jgi:hypothetical protein
MMARPSSRSLDKQVQTRPCLRALDAGAEIRGKKGEALFEFLRGAGFRAGAVSRLPHRSVKPSLPAGSTQSPVRM